jgi:hypothetical protein
MFSPGRLLTLGIFAFLIYMGFYATPGNAPGAAAFDPAVVARHEAAAWQAAAVREEFSTIVSCIMYQRELHRMSWFRAAESGMALSKAVSQFPGMTSRYERIMPQLEQVATIEKTWKGTEFDPVAVARFQVNWMTMARNTQQANNSQRAVTEMAEELGLRFGLSSGYMMAIASDRAEAYRAILPRNSSPDWDHVTQLLTRAYTNLQTTLARAAEPAPGR